MPVDQRRGTRVSVDAATTVLLAERDPYAAEFAEYFLRTDGYAVRIVLDPAAAARNPSRRAACDREDVVACQDWTQASPTLTTKTIVRNAAAGCRETRSRSDELRRARRVLLSANTVMIFPHRGVELGGVVPAAMTRRKPSLSHEATSRFSREECPRRPGQ